MDIDRQVWLFELEITSWITATIKSSVKPINGGARPNQQ